MIYLRKNLAPSFICSKCKNEDENTFKKEESVEMLEIIVLTLSCLSIYNDRVYLNLWFCFFAWYSYKNYEFYNRIKHLCNSCRK